jgi:hypothetical protein
VYLAVKRAGAALADGDEYNPGETLTVHINSHRASSVSGEFVMENSGGGSFTHASAGCAGRRVPDVHGAVLIAPTDGSALKVWGGQANAQGTVNLLGTLQFESAPTPAPTTSAPTTTAAPGTTAAPAATTTPAPGTGTTAAPAATTAAPAATTSAAPTAITTTAPTVSPTVDQQGGSASSAGKAESGLLAWCVAAAFLAASVK